MLIPLDKEKKLLLISVFATTIVYACHRVWSTEFLTQIEYDIVYWGAISFSMWRIAIIGYFIENEQKVFVSYILVFLYVCVALTSIILNLSSKLLSDVIPVYVCFFIVYILERKIYTEKQTNRKPSKAVFTNRKSANTVL